MHKTLGFLLLLVATAALGQERIELRPVVTNVPDPVAITHAGDSRLFITLQEGLVVIYDGTSLLSQPFLDLRSKTSADGERGLLSVAFHPDYAQNGFFFVNYTDLSGNTVVARYSVSTTDRDRANAGSERVILRVNQPFANHNGGQMHFGPDGYLYIGMGDGGSGGDPGNRAQNLGELLGKMLRIDVDNGNPYAIPPSNPFVNRGGARGEIWAYGLRNPWRFSFDRENGDLWIADVGQGDVEEIDYQPGTSRGGENYGWRLMEGTRCFNPATNCNSGQLVLPVIEYDHNSGCSVTGGYRYHGVRSPRLRGTYIYADYCTGTIWGATPASGGQWTSRVLIDTPMRVSTFGEDLNGEVYVAQHGDSGAIYHLVDANAIPPKRRGVRK